MLQEQKFSCFIWVSGLDNEILHRHKVAFSTKDAEVCKCLQRTIVQLRQLYLQIKKKKTTDDSERFDLVISIFSQNSKLQLIKHRQS